MVVPAPRYCMTRGAAIQTAKEAQRVPAPLASPSCPCVALPAAQVEIELMDAHTRDTSQMARRTGNTMDAPGRAMGACGDRRAGESVGLGDA
jgi:hypothetical protein